MFVLLALLVLAFIDEEQFLKTHYYTASKRLFMASMMYGAPAIGIFKLLFRCPVFFRREHSCRPRRGRVHALWGKHVILPRMVLTEIVHEIFGLARSLAHAPIGPSLSISPSSPFLLHRLPRPFSGVSCSFDSTVLWCGIRLRGQVPVLYTQS
jgi:hypothetical protein